MIVVVLGSLMGEETRDEEIETMALNTYTRLAARRATSTPMIAMGVLTSEFRSARRATGQGAMCWDRIRDGITIELHELTQGIPWNSSPTNSHPEAPNAEALLRNHAFAALSTVPVEGKGGKSKQAALGDGGKACRFLPVSWRARSAAYKPPALPTLRC